MSVGGGEGWRGGSNSLIFSQPPMWQGLKLTFSFGGQQVTNGNNLAARLIFYNLFTHIITLMMLFRCRLLCIKEKSQMKSQNY